MDVLLLVVVSEWLGDSSRDAEGKQPHGWGFQILPYIEELVLWENSKNIQATDAENKQVTLQADASCVFVLVLSRQ